MDADFPTRMMVLDPERELVLARAQRLARLERGLRRGAGGRGRIAAWWRSFAGFAAFGRFPRPGPGRCDARPPSVERCQVTRPLG